MVGLSGTAQTVITVSAFVAAIIALFGHYNKAYNWVQKTKEQEKDIEELDKKREAQLEELREEQRAIRIEQQIMTRGVLACLQGLAEQGCNGPVHKAIDEINDYLNEAAHQ